MLHLVIISHAMIGAIYAVALFIVALLMWAFRGCLFKDFIHGLSVLLLGILSVGWWLLPGLRGGITGIDVAAVKEVVQFIPAAVSFNPLQRLQNREIFYWGISLIVVLLSLFITWKDRPAWAKSLACCGLLIIVASFPTMRSIYLTLPLSHLLWPLYFSSFPILALVAAGFSFKPKDQIKNRTTRSFSGYVIAALAVFLLVDSFFSFRILALTRSKSYELMESAVYLKGSPGWRVATIDLSRLGSAPSYLFSEAAQREQVFGWAWQGAATAENIMLLNMGARFQYYPFLFRSAIFLGATDLLVKDDVIVNPAAFSSAAASAGYERTAVLEGVSVWQKSGLDQPYLVEKIPEFLIIGRYAGTIAVQFPDVEMGSLFIDDYTLDELKRYDTVILSGARWKSKQKAEQLVTDYVAAGGRIFIELAGMPLSVLARQPEFLGVYGEAVELSGSIEIFGQAGNYLLQPFSLSQDMPFWKTYLPQGLDWTGLKFQYYGMNAPVYGYKEVEGNKVWFLGGNLLYHSFLTKDPVAIELIQELTGLRRDFSGRALIPLDDYETTQNGYRMRYYSPEPLQAILPVAALDGMNVKVGGIPVEAGNFENLLQLNLPAGNHEIEIVLKKTPVYYVGLAISLLSVLIVIGWVILLKSRPAL